MHRFKKRGGVISTELEPDEVQLLKSLVGELVGLINSDRPEQQAEPQNAEDPFAAWAAELADDSPVEEPEDPVLRRLLPDAYPNDPKASAEFRRFTENNLRQKKVTDAEVVLGHLAATLGGQEPLRIPTDDAGAWLRTLTSVRLAVAGRLGITDNESAEALADIPDDDPRAFMISVYDWLGFAQETLVSTL
ncbi:MAG TPA: DUF2017 domain-containing protein [Microlunatus sp.]